MNVIPVEESRKTYNRVNMSGYPKINELGRFIKDNLPTVSCVAESSERTCYVQCDFVKCVVYVFICVQSRPVH